MIQWLVEFADGWKVLNSDELQKAYEDGLCNTQIWRLIRGRQPESRFLRSDGLIMDIFGNIEGV